MGHFITKTKARIHQDPTMFEDIVSSIWVWWFLSIAAQLGLWCIAADPRYTDELLLICYYVFGLLTILPTFIIILVKIIQHKRNPK